jgi:hypothetical protein
METSARRRGWAGARPPNRCLVACQAKQLGLFRDDQRVDRLHGDRLSFSVLPEVLAGGKYLDILKQGLSHASGPSRAAGLSTGNEHIDVHAARNESGASNNVVDRDGHGPHPLRDGRGASASRSRRGQPVFQDPVLWRKSY